ncbi:MAG: DUF4336 domain-containing protein [Cyanobacteria bacterium J06621_8]
MLREIDRHLWVVEQPQKFMGLEVGTKMTVIRLSDGSILLISPVKIDSQLQQQLDELGEVKYIVAPNLFHYLYVADCQKIYPQAQTIAPPGLTDKIPTLKVDQILTQDAIAFNSEVEYMLLEGFQIFVPPKIRKANEIIFYHPQSKTLIITDSAFNLDNSLPLVTQIAARILGSYQVLKPSWLEKIAVEDCSLLQQAIARVMNWDFERVIMAHGKIVTENAKEKLTAGYRWLLI